MSKQFFIVVLVILPLFSNAQKLVEEVKKKYYGTYVGEIPKYSLDTGKDLVEVEATNLKIQLDANYVILDIGIQHFTGTYSVLFQGSDYYVLHVTIDGQLQPERILVHMKSKTMTREGMYPQPNANLRKLSAKELKQLKN